MVDRDRLYIISSYGLLLTLARDGTLLATYTDPALRGPDGQVLVCGYLSDTVLQLATLATKEDGVWNPQSVCYSSTTSSIIVGQYGDNILDNDAEDVVDKNDLNMQKSVRGLNAWTKCMCVKCGTKCMCVKCGTKCMCIKYGTKCMCVKCGTKCMCIKCGTKCMCSVLGLNAWTKCMCVKCGTKCMCVKCETKCMCVKCGTKCILYGD
ncbi:hypothetical protein DPMN_018880 [Dreissena polymorpha]|uniref:Uncharacterized protein n=1 Tax=Dreissena polymorpha TaxID=45954 RepID=A0A9D4NE08_DREPO|nr:hypothetical protein DPMN_018880 [Dreissena polymorpha]